MQKTRSRTRDLIFIGLVALTFVFAPTPLKTSGRALRAEGSTGLNRWTAETSQEIDTTQNGETEQRDNRSENISGGTSDLSDQLSSVFDFSTLNDEEKRWAADAIGGSCDFDWDRLIPGLDGRKVSIQLGSPPAQGMYYPAETKVVVHRYFYSADKVHAARVLTWELAHAVDFLWMSPAQRSQIQALYLAGTGRQAEWLTGAYEDQIGESFMEGFVAAFCAPLASNYSQFNFKTTPEIGQGIRQILSS